MAQRKKVGASKRTFRLYDEVFNDVEEIARAENRTVTAQVEVFLRDMIKQYKKAKSEKQPGNTKPAPSAA